MRTLRRGFAIALAAALSAGVALGAQSGAAGHHHDPPGTPAHTHPASPAPVSKEPPPAPIVSAPHEHDAAVAERPAQTEAHEHAGAPIVPDPWFVRLLIGATLALAMVLFVVGRTERTADSLTPPRRGRDLLTIPILGAFLRWRHFNTLLLVPTLLVFGFVVVAGLFGEQTTDNPAILLTWILWWPAVVFTFFLVGRIWCVICPFGFVGDVAQKIVTAGRRAPRLLKNMWWRLALFLMLTWFTALFALDRTPRSTAWLALALTGGAVVLALVYEKRVFCRYVCPVGGIFGMYSMAAPLVVSARDGTVCRSECRSKDCAAACTWFQFPAHMDRGAECSLCLDCVRACPHDNLALTTRPIGSELARFRSHRTSLDEAATVAAIVGVSLVQTVVMLDAWAAWRAGPLLYTAIFLVFGLAIPLGLLAVLSLLSSRQEGRARGTGKGDRQGGAAALRTYAYAFLPLGLGLHAAHNFHHLFGESGALWTGLRTWTANVTGWWLAAATGETPAAHPNVLFFLQWLALAGGLYLAWQVSAQLASRQAADRRNAFLMALPIQLFAVAYTVMNVLVLAAPMAHRH